MESNALAITTMNVQNRLEAVSALMQIVQVMRRDMLHEGIDYGTIPGTNKPSLLLPDGMTCLSLPGLTLTTCVTLIREVT